MSDLGERESGYDWTAERQRAADDEFELWRREREDLRRPFPHIAESVVVRHGWDEAPQPRE